MKIWHGVAPKQDKHELCACGAKIIDRLFTSVICSGTSECRWAEVNLADYKPREEPLSTTMSWVQAYDIATNEHARGMVPTIFECELELGWTCSEPCSAPSSYTNLPWRKVDTSDMNVFQAEWITRLYPAYGAPEPILDGYDGTHWWPDRDPTDPDQARFFQKWRLC